MKKDTPKLVKAILDNYEAVKPGSLPEDSVQLINGQWYAPKWGCDTLQHIIETIEQLSEE